MKRTGGSVAHHRVPRGASRPASVRFGRTCSTPSIKMMIAALFALAFALAIGQAGMLSFGHSAYYGLGAFAALHVMQAVEAKLFYFPTPLVPLVGAVAGALAGIVFGWLATRRTGTYFAMLTFALAELLVAVAPGLNAVFGAESGISTMRSPSWGLSFGSDRQVYFLVLAWFVISAWCLWAFTRTPLGRLALALRDNEHRARFLGFDTHLARTVIFAISCMFAGVAGALLAITNEAANYTIFSAQVSANVVLQTFIGGVGTFLRTGVGCGRDDVLCARRVRSDAFMAAVSGPRIRAVDTVRAKGPRRHRFAACTQVATRRLAASGGALSALPRRRSAVARWRRVRRRDDPRRHVGRVSGGAGSGGRRMADLPTLRSHFPAFRRAYLGDPCRAVGSRCGCCCLWRAGARQQRGGSPLKSAFLLTASRSH